MGNSALQRKNMVESQVRPSDVTDRRITAAMQTVLRERFVPASAAALAYMDDPIAVAPGRSLMAPRTFARLIQLANIERDYKVLIIGALHGYSAAVIAALAGNVVALESIAAASDAARSVLDDLGISKVKVVTGPLHDGWLAGAPYDVIFAEGAVERVPQPILDQLSAAGRLVAVEVSGGVGRAVVLQKSGSAGQQTVSRRVAFEISASPLPGFELPKTFTF
jgi:protein-L-isoaspartate(D-aspartate) O-methyltransferase